jgi:hypothetical protein
MSNVRISQLPTGSALTGTELVPVVQNGQTIQTTVSSFTSSPTLTQTFVTVNNTPSLANSRYFAVGTGIGLTDTGAQGQLQIALNGTSGSLETVGNGFIAKTAANTVANRTFSTTSGLSITNGDGISGNPVLSVTGLLSALAATTGTGLMATAGGSTITPVTIAGTSNQTSVSNGNTSPVIGLANDPIIPGSGGITIPNGNSAQRIDILGTVRYNTSLNSYEGYTLTGWNQFSLSGGVTSFQTTLIGLTPSSATAGGVSLDGTLGAASGGTGATTLTGYVKGNGTSAMTAAATVPTSDLSGTISNGQLANSSITIGSTSVALGSTITTLAGTSISGSANTLSNIANSSLTNSSVTIGSTSIALGATTSTLTGLTSVAVTQDPTSALQLATKQYVDAVAEGLHIHASCAAATTGTLASITGGTVTYNNGTAGVGATLTLSVALTVLDGYTLLNGDRVLIKNEATQANNGIYTWATGGTVLTRATDFDTAAEMASGDFTFVVNGTLYANTGWVQTDPVTVVGTSPVTWVQFSGAGAYTAGTGLTLTGTQFSLTNPVAINLGGTGQTSASAAFNALSPITTTGDLILGNGTNSATRLAIGSNGYLLTSNGTTASWVAAPASGVTTFSAGTTGFTPATATSGAITLAGTLVVGNGGTGVATLTGLAYGNGTSAFTAATGAEVVAVIGSTAVTNATNATNVGITAASSGATNYLTFVTATTGNLPELVNSSITCNAATGAITGGISGGTF